MTNNSSQHDKTGSAPDVNQNMAENEMQRFVQQPETTKEAGEQAMKKSNEVSPQTLNLQHSQEQVQQQTVEVAKKAPELPEQTTDMPRQLTGEEPVELRPLSGDSGMIQVALAVVALALAVMIGMLSPDFTPRIKSQGLIDDINVLSTSLFIIGGLGTLLLLIAYTISYAISFDIGLRNSLKSPTEWPLHRKVGPESGEKDKYDAKIGSLNLPDWTLNRLFRLFLSGWPTLMKVLAVPAAIIIAVLIGIAIGSDRWWPIRTNFTNWFVLIPIGFLLILIIVVPLGAAFWARCKHKPVRQHVQNTYIKISAFFTLTALVLLGLSLLLIVPALLVNLFLAANEVSKAMPKMPK